MGYEPKLIAPFELDHNPFLWYNPWFLKGENMPKAYDFNGFKNENFEVIERIGTKGNYATWKCRCKCGGEKILRSRDINNAKCCDDCIYEDKTGKTFNSWTVLKYEGIHKNTGSQWLCRCECGIEKIIRGGTLASGKSKSCGCAGLKFWKKINRPLCKFKKRFCGILYLSHKGQAKRRNIDFKLTTNEFFDLIHENCFYCGSSPNNERKIKESPRYNEQIYFYNGIDRVKNDVGYEKQNCVSCCKVCNTMKMQLSKNDFFIHIKKIYQRIDIK